LLTVLECRRRFAVWREPTSVAGRAIGTGGLPANAPMGSNAGHGVAVVLEDE
jgi:hypothetical protein